MSLCHVGTVILYLVRFAWHGRINNHPETGHLFLGAPVLTACMHFVNVKINVPFVFFVPVLYMHARFPPFTYCCVTILLESTAAC
jgi:hypothetical protein